MPAPGTGDRTTIAEQTRSGLTVTRRKFLKRGAVTGAALGALYVVPQMTSVRARPAYANATPPGLPTEVDEFETVFMRMDLIGLPGQPPAVPTTVDVTGSATIHAKIGLSGETVNTDNGEDAIETEIVAMSLTGNVGGIPITVEVNPAHNSIGQITETTNNTPGVLDLPPFNPGTADSFFDVFFLITLNGEQFYNAVPSRMAADPHVTHKPVGPDERHFGTAPVQLDSGAPPTDPTLTMQGHFLIFITTT